MRSKIVLVVAVLFLGGCPPDDGTKKLDDDFLADLGSENSRIAGDLYLYVFNRNLDTLRYDAYIAYLSQHESASAAGLTQKIRAAGRYYFASGKSWFIIGLEYPDIRAMVCDNSNTWQADTVIYWKAGDAAPKLEDVAKAVEGR